MARYLVGPNQTYATIQEAVEAVGVSVGSADFTEEHEILVSESGVYEGFRLEPGMLSPTSSYRLIVRGAAEVQALVTKSEAFGATGCLIGSDVPYVTVQNLWFKDLDRGIVVGVNSHGAHIDRCYFLLCREVGIWVYQADECFLSNIYAHNSTYCVAAQRVKGIALAHCTLYNDSKFSEDPSYLMLLELETANKKLPASTGQIFLYNNIFYSHSSFGLAIYRKNIQQTPGQGKFINSNYNDWYFPSSGPSEGGTPTSALVEIREVLSGGSTSTKYCTELKPANPVQPTRDAWTVVSGEDTYSISDDPRFPFSKPNYLQENPSPNFIVAHIGPPNLCGDLFGYLPSWADDSTLCVDLKGAPRTSQFPTIGATEVQVAADYEILEDPSGAEMDCGPDPVDPITSRYEENVPVWLPKIHRGIFYLRDEEYHLYVNKQSTDAANATRYTWNLSSLLLEEGIRITAGGIDVTDTARWNLTGYTFTLYQADLDPVADIIVEGYTRYWDEDAHAFKRNSPGTYTKHRLRAIDALITYVLPSKPEFGAPVVVTDDLLQPSDTLALAQEFKVEYDAHLDEAHIEFGGARNLWKNPDFAYLETGNTITGAGWGLTGAYPESHEFSDDSFLSVVEYTPTDGTNLEILPLRAGRALLMETGDSETWIGQRVPVDPDQPYVLSAYGSSFSATETGSFQVSLTFYDWDNLPLGGSGPYSVEFDPASDMTTEWERIGVHLYNTPDNTADRPALSEFVDTVIADPISIPANSESVFVKFERSTGNAALLLDCIQFEKGYEATPFTRIPKGEDLTIEWEGGEGRFYTIDDMNLHPIRNTMANGFVTITPQSAKQWDKNANTGTNTLTDFRWPWGRLNLLPWAKLSGFNKYRRRVWFSTDRVPIEDTVSIAGRVAQPARIQSVPDLVVATAGTDGTLFHVNAWDDQGNPYAFENARVTLYDTELEFPGYLVKSEWSVPVELGQQIIAELDEAGSKTFRYIPPEDEDIFYHGDQPSIIQDTTGEFAGSSYGYVRTKYRVLPENHGGATVQDQFGTSYDVTGSLVDAVYYGQYYTDGVTRIKLPKHPIPGTMEIYGTETGITHDTPFPEMHGTPLIDRHMSVDYQRRTLSIRGSWPKGFRVKYNPRLVWYSKDFPRRMYVAKDVLDQITGDMVIHYDAEVQMVVEAMPPQGYVQGDPLYKAVRVVVQHTDR